MKVQKKLWVSFILLMSVVVIGVGAFFGINAWRQAGFNKIRAQALEELNAAEGRYEESSIVLADTSKAEAQKLAELLGAELRMTEDGEYAALALPEGVTIRDVYENEEYGKYIGEMSIDYHVSVADGRKGYHEGRHHRQPKRPNRTFSDADYGKQTEYDYVNIENTWSTATGKNITVAILDTGIDTDHPEFAGRISEYSYNASEDKIVKDYLTEDGEYDWSLIEDEQGHGTTVTGVISASMNSGKVVGMAPGANFIVIKAECNEYGEYRRTSDLVFGIYYAIERGANVLNMSFGADEMMLEAEFADALQLAYDSDMVCVASAGNEESSAPFYPAASENVIGVGALASNSWDLANYSNYGENTDITAPGTVYTTVMGGGYGLASGTSYSAPMVTGAVALLMQSDKYMTVDEVTELLYASAYDLGDLGPDNYFGYGLIDVNALVNEERITVSFDMLTDELENTEQTVISGHTIMDIPEPERLYAIFDGWYYDDTFTQEYVYYEDIIRDDITLYAKWVNEDDGIPYTYVTLDDGTVEIRSYTGRRRYITVPEIIDSKTVSSIGDGAFAGESEFRQVTLPDTITTIGERAFQGCSNLISIEIPKQVVTIESEAFSGCARLEIVHFQEDAKLRSIMDNAFQYCARLKEIQIPKTVTTLDGSVFLGATSLRRVDVALGNSAFVSDDGVVFTKSKRTIVVYPAAHGTTYELPSVTTKIANSAFAFSKLSTLDLGRITSIQTSAFYRSNLQKAEIPDSVVELGKFAFACSRVRTVTIGSGLTKIEEHVFDGCDGLSTVEIGANILSIEDYAFNKSGLKTLSFAEGANIVSIGQNAFFQNKGLRRLDIPASLLEIGVNAFEECMSLTEIAFEEGSHLKKIGDNAFNKNYSLAVLTLPERLETLGENAFNSSAITTVTVPASVTDLGVGAFGGCTSLIAIDVAEGNKKYHDIDGVVFNLDNTSVFAYPAGRTASTYDLPDSVKIIEPYAFSVVKKLSSVTLHEGLEEIGESAFYFSASLSKIDVPNSVVQIGRYAFSQSGIRQVNFKETSKLPRIGYAAFAYSSITSLRIPANVSTVSQGAFYGCDKLTAVTFAAGSKLDNLPAHMFDGCNNLASLIFEEGSNLRRVQAHGLEGMAKLTAVDFSNTKLEEIDNFSFRFCEALASVTLPEGTLNIGRYAFYGCNALAELSVPSTVEHIGPFAFLGTNNVRVFFKSESLPLYIDENWDYGISGYYLGVQSVHTSGDFEYAITTSENIAILDYTGSATVLDLTAYDFGGEITIIGGGAFEGSTVESITLPDTLTTIQANAFAYSPLQKLELPASVTFIGKFAFAETPLASVEIPAESALRSIEQYAFTKTEKLSEISLPASLEIMGSGVFCESALSSVIFAEDILLEEIPQKAFAETKLQSVVIPDSVVLINHNAFNNVQTLDSVTFGSGEDLRLMSNAFYHTGLSSLHIPANVTYIGEYCFVAVSNLKEFTVDAENLNYAVYDGLLTTKTGRKLIAVPAGRTGTLEVPIEIEEIGFGAFEESKLSAVTFKQDANILSLGNRAFFKANNISEVHIPASVVSVDYYAFAYCENLEKVTFAEGNQLNGIYEGAFCGDEKLKDITIPETVVEISDFAFYGCENLKEMPLHETTALLGIYDYAFAYSGISGELLLPGTLLDIGEYAFLSTDITSATVPDANQTLLFIEKGVFEECAALEEITLPFVGMEYEGENGFFGYIFGAGSYEAGATFVPESLKTATITEGITYFDEGAFYGLEHLERIILPESLVELGGNVFAGTDALCEFPSPVAIRPTSLGSGVCGELNISEFYQVDHEMRNTFENCKYLTGVSLPEGVVTLNSTFKNCENLEWVDIPASAIDWGWYIFEGCKKLKSVEIPEGVTLLGVTFKDCSSLESVILPDSVTKFSQAFSGCSSLKSVHIPAGVVDLGGSSWEARNFTGCSSLKEITVDPENEYFCDVDGILMDDAQTAIITGPKAMEAAHFEIPKTVTAIGADAFNDCSGIKKITVPATVKTISGGFDNCTGLEELVFEDGEEGIAPYLELRGFNGCTNLKKITFGNTVKGVYGTVTTDPFTGTKITDLSIPDSMEQLAGFRNSSNLKTLVVGDGVKTIEDDAFSDCPVLETVRLGNNLSLIGYGVFENSNAINSITVGANITMINHLDFSKCYDLKEVYNNSDLNIYPGDINNGHVAYFANFVVDKNGNKIYTKDDASAELITTEDGFEFIKAAAGYTLIGYVGDQKEVTLPVSIEESSYTIKMFDGAEHVIVPEGVTKIDSYAFAASEELKSIKIASSVTKMESYVFQNCINLETVEMGDGIKSMGYSCFAGCSSLKEVHLSESLSIILSGTFTGCTALEKINIPESVKEIGSSAFAKTNLTEVVINHDLVLTNSIFEGCTRLKKVVLPKNPTYYWEGDDIKFMFNGCTALETVVLPENLVNITNKAFGECTSLKTIVIPESVKTIGSNAFYKAESLSEIIIPNSVETIASNAFSGCKNLQKIQIGAGVSSMNSASFANCVSLKEIEVSENNPNYCSIDGIVYNKAKTEILFAPPGLEGEVVIPEGVEKISDNVFTNFTKITALRLPSTLNYFGSMAGCTGITELVIPEGVTHIGNLNDCINLEKINVPDGVTYLGSFANCKNLKAIQIPDGVTTVGSFVNCASLESVILPDSVVNANLSFEKCTSLKKVVLGNGIETCPRFYECSNLESVTLSSKITSIPRETFRFCKKLLEIEIPEGVTSIGSYSFDGCVSLVRAEIPDSVKAIDQNAFYNCPLEEAQLPASLTSLGNSAFYGAKITSVEIPAGLASFTGGFGDCVHSVTVHEDNPSYVAIDNVVYNKEVTEIVYVPMAIRGTLIIPETVKTIASSVFYGRKCLDEVILHDGVISIGQNAFGSSAITKITLGKGLTTIGSNAFFSCSKLETVVNNSSLQLTLGTSDYGSVAAYAKKLVQGGVTTYAGGVSNLVYYQTDDGFRFSEKDGVYTMIAYVGDQDTVTLPLTFNGQEYAISLVNGIKHLIIPDGMKKIAKDAFSGSTTLSSVYLPDSVEEIGASAFRCRNLKEVRFSENLKIIGNSAFYDTLLETVVLPDSVETIGDLAFSAFYSEKRVKDLYLGSNIKSFKGFNRWDFDEERRVHFKSIDSFFAAQTEGIFDSNTWLYIDEKPVTAITVPRNVNQIAGKKFFGYGHLESVTLHDGITVIREQAFYDCIKLQSITIPERVTALNKEVFRGSGLRELILPNGIVSIGKDVLTDTPLMTEQQYRDPNGALIIDDYLFDVAEETKYIEIPNGGFECIAEDAYTNAYSLKNAEYYNGLNLSSLSATNVENLYITDFEGATPLKKTGSMKTVIITDHVDAVDLRHCEDFFSKHNVQNVTIYVEGNKDDLRWDDNFPGWHNGNKVVYGDNWSWTRFYDTEGALIYCEPRLNSAVIRLPAQEMPDSEHYTYKVIGWDLDGDGEADNVPATSVVDIIGYPVTKAVAKVFTVTFADMNGSIYSTKQFTYGETITLPEQPQKTGYSFTGWSGYTEGMTASADVTLTATWTHDGAGHLYGEAVTVDPTCEEQGYDRKTCSICGEHEDSNFVDALGHDEKVETIDPTCTEKGYDQHSCSRCDKIWATKLTQPTGHSYGDWIIDVAPECEVTGTHHRICSACGDVENAVAEAAGHDYTETVMQEATCKKVGRSMFTCKVCEDVTYESINKTSHKYQKRNASIWFIEMLADAYGDLVYSLDGERGYYYTCAYCGEFLTSLAYGEGILIQDGCQHGSTSEVVVNELTCESDGVKGQKCNLCQAMVSGYVYAYAAGHDYSEGDDWAADLKNHWRYCTVCHELQAGTEAAHTYLNSKTTCDTCAHERKIASIEISTLPAKVKYLEAKDPLDLSGAELSVTYDDGAVLTEGITAAMVAGFDNTIVGEQNLTVTYEGFTDTFEVEIIAKELTAIKVTTLPEKLRYLEAKDLLDVAGGKVTLYYNNDTSKEIDLEKSMVTGFDNTKVGTQKLTVTYEGFTNTFEVEIIAKSLASIEVTKLPTKSTYLEGKELFEPEGGIITLHYDNGTSDEIGLAVMMISGFDNTKVGKQKLTVTYEGFTDTFEVEILAKSLVSIEVTTLPTKQTYLEAKETLDVSGGKVTLYYNNDSTEEIDLLASMVTGFDHTKVGPQELTVTHEGFTDTFKIEIISKSLRGIEISTLPTKTEYLEAKDLLDVAGGKVILTYDNDTTEEIDLDTSMITGFDNTKVGPQELTVTYGGFTDAFEIEIIAKSLESIEVTDLPTKTEYLEAKEQLDVIGGKVTLYYNNDTHKVIDLAPSMISGFDNTKVGVQELKVTYEDFEDTFEIEIIAKSLVRIEVTTLPTKLTYIQQTEELDLTGGIITLYYDNDTTGEIALSEAEVSGFDYVNIGQNTLTVVYGEKETAFEVEILERPKTINGEVTFFGEGEATLRLLKNGETIQTVTTEDGAYLFEGIYAGDYTIEISKANHAVKTFELTVEEDDIDLNFNLYMMGDVNNNGEVTIADAVLILRVLNETLDAQYIDETAANVVADDIELTTADAILILRHAMGEVSLYSAN